MKFSDPDKVLLRHLQRDISASLATLAERCGMSQSTVWRKIQEFDATGVIRRRVALLDPASLNVKLTVLASISLEDHSEKAVAGFAQLVQAHAEITECHAVSGASDYILKVRVTDVEAYERFMTTTLLRNPVVRAVQSSFVLREIKSTTELPI